MALTGPRSVAINSLHPCSHWPLFAIAPTQEWIGIIFLYEHRNFFEEDPYLNISKRVEIFKHLDIQNFFFNIQIFGSTAHLEEQRSSGTDRSLEAE